MHTQSCRVHAQLAQSMNLEPFENAIGRETPEWIRRFYAEFDLTNVPGEFFEIPVDRFLGDRLQIQYFNSFTGTNCIQHTPDAIYFCFAAGTDELDWWLRIDRTSEEVTICSTYVDGKTPLHDLECYALSLAELLTCPFRRL